MAAWTRVAIWIVILAIVAIVIVVCVLFAAPTSVTGTTGTTGLTGGSVDTITTIPANLAGQPIEAKATWPPPPQAVGTARGPVSTRRNVTEAASMRPSAPAAASTTVWPPPPPSSGHIRHAPLATTETGLSKELGTKGT